MYYKSTAVTAVVTNEQKCPFKSATCIVHSFKKRKGKESVSTVDRVAAEVSSGWYHSAAITASGVNFSPQSHVEPMQSAGIWGV